MEAILEMQILERFRKKGKINENIEELEEQKYCKASFGDADEAIPFVAEAVVEVCKISGEITAKNKTSIAKTISCFRVMDLKTGQ